MSALEEALRGGGGDDGRSTPSTDDDEADAGGGGGGSGGRKGGRGGALTVHEVAAVYMDDARASHSVAHRTDAGSVAAYRVLHGRGYGGAYTAVVLLHLSLALLERSSSRAAADDAAAPAWATSAAEVGCCIFYLADLHQHRRVMRVGWRPRWGAVKLGAAGILAVGAIVTACVPSCPLVFRLLRPVFVVEHYRSVRKVASAIVKTVPKIAAAATLLLLWVFVASVAAVILFQGMTLQACPSYTSPERSADRDAEYCSTFTQNCTDYFGAVRHAMLNLFIMLSTANYPDVM